MKEIANLADTVSTERMDSRDKKLLEDVKDAVHSCLMDVVGEPRKVRRKTAAKRKKIDDSNGKDE